MYTLIYNSILIIISLSGIITLIIRKEIYKAEKSFIIMTTLINFLHFTYFFLFTFSTFYVLTESLALVIWKFSLFFYVFSLVLWTSLHVLELYKNSKIKYIPLLVFLILTGAILSLLLLPDSISITRLNQDYHFNFNSYQLLNLILILSIILIGVLVFFQLSRFSNVSDRSLGKLYTFYASLLSINTIIYLFYLYTMNDLFKHIHLILYLIDVFYFFFTLINNPSIFVIFTNKLYNFIIFHKSGVLLYSYDFETNQELEESLLKGSILIGINHILSNFSNIENQISSINLKRRGILFQFNNKLGYATLLIVKHKSNLVEQTLKDFNLKFSEKYGELLLNLKGLIDVSEFKQTTQLIKDEFKLYIIP